HELLGKVLTSLELCSLAVGPDNEQVAETRVRFEKVPNPRHERSFRAHHNQIDGVFYTEIGYRRKIIGQNVNVTRNGARSWIPRSDVQLTTQWALGYLPGQSMFTSAIPD